ncbi:MAG: hypothetical protein LW636_00940, partial [Planctomycetaceae bacterium]|nr:hypothetical protein [Planctomycetaceae bacterium]
SQAYFLMAPANGKLSFQAAGAATDLVVIRLADGTVFATATIEQLLKGITGDHKLPEEPKLDSKEASAGSESVDSSDRQSPDVAWKSLAGRVEILRAEFTFASIPWAFHGGSVSIYRGASELDRDMILLY